MKKYFKFNWLLDIIIINIIIAYAFFIVFQFDHEVADIQYIPENMPKLAEENVIKVMTYNIAHGRGYLSMYDKSSFGRNFNIKSKKEVFYRLDKISDLVKAEDIDILILEEVDFSASWSYHIDEAMHIAKKAGFNNVVKGIKWSVDLPFLKIRSGNAILSKYNLMWAQNKKFESESIWRRLVGGHSYLSGLYLIGNKPIKIIASHFDSDSAIAREQEATEIVEAVAESNYPVILAGDFNSVTSETKKENKKMRKKYLDNTIEIIIESNLFDIDMDKLEPNRKFTYSAENPHRLIDYIFATPKLRINEYYVVKEKLSDHFPLVARISLNNLEKD